jgi:hypothetical protein
LIRRHAIDDGSERQRHRRSERGRFEKGIGVGASAGE